ncbi:MAG TPA: ABC transporter substrate-binding protein [Meiothermus sp.]|nr:ABC transporter substrate-binding protein [Meiothermus sp.]
MKKWIWFLLLAVSYPLSAIGFAQYPKALTDDLGRKVTIQAEPKRIVTMLPSLTETLCAMGACDRLVATDSFSDWPESVKKLPKMGALFDASPEKIVALKPDLVLISVYGKLQEPLERSGIPTFALKVESYGDIFRTTRLLGEILNHKPAAERLVAQIQQQVYAQESRAAKAKDRPTVYLEIDPTPYTVGPGSFIGVLIAKARGQNIIPKELGDFPQVSPELVVQKNPQVIVLTHPGAADLAKRPGWARLRAIQANRVCSFTGGPDNLLSRPGPRVAEGLKLLIDCLHPELR